MDISIREHIIHNFQNDDIETLKKAIDQSIQEKDEITLPGLGVFFEIVWSDSNDKMKQEILNILKNRLSLEK